MNDKVTQITEEDKTGIEETLVSDVPVVEVLAPAQELLPAIDDPADGMLATIRLVAQMPDY